MYIEKPLYTWIRAVGRSLCSHCCFGQINRRTWCPIRSPGNWCSLDRSCREWGKYRRGWMCQLQKRKMNGGCTVDTVFYNPYMHRFRLKELTWAITGGSTVARVAVTAVTIHVIHTRAVDARATAALIYVSCQSESVNSAQHRNIITYMHVLWKNVKRLKAKQMTNLLPGVGCMILFVTFYIQFWNGGRGGRVVFERSFLDYTSEMLTAAVDSIVASSAWTGVAIDVVSTRSVHTRAAGTLIDVSCNQCTFINIVLW